MTTDESTPITGSDHSPPPSGGVRRVVRFGAVGVANTAIDFGLLFGLVTLGAPALIANTISTGAGLAFSFWANRNFTFRSTGIAGRELVRFLAITLIGLWVLQPIIIFAIQLLLESTTTPMLSLLIAKIAATAATMIWNYLLYARLVFRHTAITSRRDTP